MDRQCNLVCVVFKRALNLLCRLTTPMPVLCSPTSCFKVTLTFAHSVVCFVFGGWGGGVEVCGSKPTAGMSALPSVPRQAQVIDGM